MEYLFVHEVNTSTLLFLIFGLLTLFLIGKLIEVYGYDYKSIITIKKHEFIDALIKKENYIIIWFFYPIIFLTEELIFRYYSISFLLNELNLSIFSAIFISSLLYSLFHIHIWFSSKNRRITLIYIGYSFLLGLFNGYILLTLGIFPCILIHYILVSILYYNIYRRYFKNKIDK